MSYLHTFDANLLMLLPNLQNLGRKPNHCDEGRLTRKIKCREAELGKRGRGNRRRRRRRRRKA
jgi:hypothetical protein